MESQIYQNIINIDFTCNNDNLYTKDYNQTSNNTIETNKLNIINK